MMKKGEVITNRLNTLLITIVLILASGLLTAEASVVSGPISGNTTWYVSESPYIVTGDITVLSGVALTIEPGVTVKFDSGYGLDIQGSFAAVGGDSNLITFTSNAAVPQKDDWGGISYTYNTGSSFAMDYVIVEYSSYGISYSASTGTLSPAITNSIIRNTGGDGIYVYGSGTADITLSLSDNQVYANDGRGIYCRASGVYMDSTVSGNQVHNNGDDGVYHYYTSSPGSSFTAKDNTVYDNIGYGIYWDHRHSTYSGIIDGNIVYDNSADGIYVLGTYDTGSILEIINNEVYNNGRYGIRWTISGNMLPVVSSNKVYGNSNDGMRGNGSAANPRITHNDVYNNGNNGIHMNASTVSYINHNNIYGNADYGIYNYSDDAVDGRSNWWGAAATAEMDAGGNPKDIGAIYDIHDNGAKGWVDYRGWLSSPLTLDGSPLSHITNILDGEVVRPGFYTISGAGTAGAGIEKVEVSVDGGSTWEIAEGTYYWSYSVNITAGVYSIMSRITDKDGITETPGAGVTLTAEILPPPTTSGELPGDETWSGIVDITGDVTVPSGITLTITPGTVIRFEDRFDYTYGGYDNSRSELIVEGSLAAVGDASNQITFTSNASVPLGT